MMKKPNYIIELKLLPDQNDLAVLHKRFMIGEKMYNQLVSHASGRLKQMRMNKEYKRTITQYLTAHGDDKKHLSQKLTLIRENFGLTEYQFHTYIKKQQQNYKKHIDANTAQKLATTVWKGVSDCLFSNGDKVHYKKRGDLLSLEGKKNTQGIRFKANEKMFCWNGLQIPVKIRGNDHFAHESLENPIKYCRIIRKPFKLGYKYWLCHN